MESHDNLIKKVYEQELTILPTRMDTLQFHKSVEDSQPSPLTNDCISQAMLVTYEKLINDSKHENSFLIK